VVNGRRPAGPGCAASPWLQPVFRPRSATAGLAQKGKVPANSRDFTEG